MNKTPKANDSRGACGVFEDYEGCHSMSKHPITDAFARPAQMLDGKAGPAFHEVVDAHITRRLEEDRAELVEALREVCDAVEAFRRVEITGKFSERLADKHDDAIIYARALLSRIDGDSHD